MQNNIKEKTLLNRVVTNIDWLLVGAFLFLVTTGIVTIFSATQHYGNPGKFLTTQLLAVMLGVFGMIFFIMVNYQLFRQPSYIIYGLSIFLLLLVLLFGSTVRGTKGWFNLGYFAFQPVEITKIVFILVLAGYLDKNWRDIKKWWKLSIPLGLLLGHIGLILMQPDFSSTLVYLPVTIILLFVAGAEPLYLIAMMLFGGIAMGIPLAATYVKLVPNLMAHSAALRYFVKAAHGGMPALIILFTIVAGLFIIWWLIKNLRYDIPFIYFALLSVLIVFGSLSSGVVQKSIKEYQRKRLIVFLNPDIDPLGSGYNIIQSKIAIGSGRLMGKGIFSGTQSQLGFLPEQHTDFIFSVIGEEMGFFYSITVIFGYFLLVWRGLLVAKDARDRYGSLVAVGISTMFAFYAIINIGMVMGLMPATGLPLPLLSYGGSAMVSAFWAMGILFSIHIRRFTH